MLKIPFGQIVTYGEIAKRVVEMRHGLSLSTRKMSAQAVGGAVGWNPICIIIPCHRVIGVKGNLTGYGGGMHNKIALLKQEGHDMNQFSIPNQSTVL
jgi:methylated-DNA-[protein]-cysteine S-methyltransferase